MWGRGKKRHVHFDTANILLLLIYSLPYGAITWKDQHSLKDLVHGDFYSIARCTTSLFWKKREN